MAMTAQKQAALKKIQAANQLYMIFSNATKLPFVKCDAESFDDQAYLFQSKADAERFVEEYGKKNYAVHVETFDKKATLAALSNLNYIGVNRVAFYSSMNYTYLPLEEIVIFHTPAQEENKPPVSNPTLTLTTIYFLQEARRTGVDNTPERLKELKELEEEMIVNFSRSKMIIPYKAPEEGDTPENKDKMQAIILKAQNAQGNADVTYQPMFTDMWECKKFINANKMNARLITVPFNEVKKFIVDISSGYLVNPTDVALLLKKERFK